ncbi:putative Female sterile M3 [Daphnia magna]|uniref:Putative Female sterile M3 n=1 Tax=Daphnia magna TaxID=35525 RepID=A0A164J173_9CRUS|nr:putative Female sterile M3 [Daphnia magna]
MNDLLIENSLNGRDVNDIVSKGLRRKTLDFVQWPEITIHGHVTFMVVKASLTFCDASINVHGSQTLSLCRTVNPVENR